MTDSIQFVMRDMNTVDYNKKRKLLLAHNVSSNDGKGTWSIYMEPTTTKSTQGWDAPHQVILCHFGGSRTEVPTILLPIMSF
jgi:hypothetical protein